MLLAVYMMATGTIPQTPGSLTATPTYGAVQRVDTTPSGNPPADAQEPAPPGVLGGESTARPLSPATGRDAPPGGSSRPNQPTWSVPDDRVTTEPDDPANPSRAPDGTFRVTVDARELSTTEFAITGVGSQIDSKRAQQFQMAPGRYRLAIGAIWADTYFTITTAGTVDYDAGISYLGGRGRTTLTVHGLPVTIDATTLEASTFGVSYVLGQVSPREQQHVRVLPARYRLCDGTRWSQAYFTVTAGGMVQYDRAATYLSGSGSRTLRTTTATLPT